LESALADLLGSLLIVTQAGDDGYYSIGNFGQRIDLVEGVVRGSFELDREKAIVKALFERIRRLWKTRNALIHSHYVYFVNREGGGRTVFREEGPEIGPHPRDFMLSPSRAFVGRGDGSREWFEFAALDHGFGYERHGAASEGDIVPVNKGTFQNHADKLLKRTRQLKKLARAVKQRVVKLRQSSLTTYTKLPPRSRLDRPESQEPPAD